MVYFDIKTKKDLIAIKEKLKNMAHSERLSDINFQENINKIYKPIVEPLQKLAQENKKTVEALDALNKKEISPIVVNNALTASTSEPPLAIEDKKPIMVNIGNIAYQYLIKVFKKDYDNAYGVKIEDDGSFKIGNTDVNIEDKKPIMVNIGNIAYQYLIKVFKKDYDNAYGVKIEDDGSFKIGNTDVNIEGNNIVVGDKKFPGTEGVWKLLSLRDVGNLNDYDDDDIAIYHNLILETKPFLKDDGVTVKANRGKKWDLIKHIYKNYIKDQTILRTERIKKVQQEQRRRSSSLSESSTSNSSSLSEREKYMKNLMSGKGLNSIIIPSDINKLISRHKLLFKQMHAGNTAVFNELQVINDHLLERNILSLDDITNFNKFYSLKNEY